LKAHRKTDQHRPEAELSPTCGSSGHEFHRAPVWVHLAARTILNVANCADADAGAARWLLPALRSGNPFRRYPSGSSQQAGNLRYGGSAETRPWVSKPEWFARRGRLSLAAERE
jgi:hypothetical protein